MIRALLARRLSPRALLVLCAMAFSAAALSPAAAFRPLAITFVLMLTSALWSRKPRWSSYDASLPIAARDMFVSRVCVRLVSASTAAAAYIAGNVASSHDVGSVALACAFGLVVIAGSVVLDAVRPASSRPPRARRRIVRPRYRRPRRNRTTWRSSVPN